MCMQPAKIRWKRSLIKRFLQDVYEDRAGIIFSVWGKCYVHEPGSCQLKACSSSFAERVGLARPRCLKYTEITLAPEVARLTEEERAAAIATREALYRLADQMTKSNVQQGRGTVATISLSGKLTFSHLHVVCLRHHRDEPFEFVVAELPLDEGEEFLVSLTATTALDARLYEALNPPKRKPRGGGSRRGSSSGWSLTNPEQAPRQPLKVCLVCGLENSLVMRYDAYMVIWKEFFKE